MWSVPVFPLPGGTVPVFLFLKGDPDSLLRWSGRVLTEDSIDEVLR
jgi:hypothetical protein